MNLLELLVSKNLANEESSLFRKVKRMIFFCKISAAGYKTNFSKQVTIVNTANNCTICL